MMFLHFTLGVVKADSAEKGHTNGGPDIQCPYVAALAVSLASRRQASRPLCKGT
jgi:hypothetical protein